MKQYRPAFFFALFVAAALIAGLARAQEDAPVPVPAETPAATTDDATPGEILSMPANNILARPQEGVIAPATAPAKPNQKKRWARPPVPTAQQTSDGVQ